MEKFVFGEVAVLDLTSLEKSVLIVNLGKLTGLAASEFDVHSAEIAVSHLTPLRYKALEVIAKIAVTSDYYLDDLLSGLKADEKEYITKLIYASHKEVDWVGLKDGMLSGVRENISLIFQNISGEDETFLYCLLNAMWYYNPELKRHSHLVDIIHAFANGSGKHTNLEWMATDINNFNTCIMAAITGTNVAVELDGIKGCCEDHVDGFDINHYINILNDKAGDRMGKIRKLAIELMEPLLK